MREPCSAVEVTTIANAVRRGAPVKTEAKCERPARWRDKDGDGWCGLHASKSEVLDKFGPMNRIGKP